MSLLGERVRQKLRKRLYESMLLQEIAFFDAHGKGQLVAMMGEDVVRIQQAVTDQITAALRSATTITYGLYRVLSISPYATLLVAGAVPVLSMASVVAQGVSRKKAMRAYEASRETAHTASEVLANARTVQSFGAEAKEAARYSAALDEGMVIEGEYRVFTGLAHLGFNALNAFLYAGGMWYGGSLVAQGKTSMEDMMQVRTASPDATYTLVSPAPRLPRSVHLVGCRAEYAHNICSEILTVHSGLADRTSSSCSMRGR